MVFLLLLGLTLLTERTLDCNIALSANLNRNIRSWLLTALKLNKIGVPLEFHNGVHFWIEIHVRVLTSVFGVRYVVSRLWRMVKFIEFVGGNPSLEDDLRRYLLVILNYMGQYSLLLWLNHVVNGLLGGKYH